MPTVKAKRQRARRPIVGRPIKWSQMTTEQRAAACEEIRNSESFLCDVPDTDTLETFRWVLEEKFGFVGVEGWKFHWSLSSCQGDGVAFTGDIEVEALAFKHPALMKYVGPIMLGKYDCRFVCSVKHDGDYCHWNSMTVTVEAQHEYDCNSEEADRMDGFASSGIEGVVSDIVKDASRACERAGYDEIKSTRYDEYVGDMISANEWEFTFDEEGDCTWE